MKLWLIYRNYYEFNAQYVPESMREAGTKLNIECEIFFEDYFSFSLIDNEVRLFYKSEEIRELPTAVFCRCYNFDLMDYLEQHNVALVNSLRGMKLCKDKFKTHLVARSLGILQPKTIKVRECDYNFLVAQLGSPFVLKDNTGQKGENVYLINDERHFLEVKQNMHDFICQEFMQKANGHDIRLYVIGEQIVDAVERVAKNGDFRSNVYQGATGFRIDVPQSLKDTALKLAHTIGLSVCSVDFLKSDEEFYLCEVNGNAAFSSFLGLGYDMQNLLMEYILKTNSH